MYPYWEALDSTTVDIVIMSDLTMARRIISELHLITDSILEYSSVRLKNGVNVHGNYLFIMYITG